MPRMHNMKKIEPSIAALRLFSAIAQSGKLTRAARRLHISQSGASHALSVLEAQLGASLFLRNHEGLELSEAGRRLLPYVQGVLSNLEAVREELSALANLQSGTLHLASVPSLAATILPPLIREFSRRYPRIEISLFEGTDNEVRDWLISGMAQVGFAALPVEGVQGEEVARDEWLALVPEREFRRKQELGLRELSRQKFFMSGGGCEWHIQQLFAGAGLAVPEHLMVRQLATIQAMVAENLGASLVPSLSVLHPLKGSRALPLKPRRFRRIGLLRSPNAARTPAAEAWIALTKAQIGELVKGAARA